MLLGGDQLEQELSAAEQIREYSDRVKRIGAEESRLRSSIEALRPWTALELPLEQTETERCSVLLGTMPARTDLTKAQSALAEGTEEAELFPVSSDKSQ